ncbi:MAG: helix-turn-helix domain-containing protein [Candidatus Omnitrophota bacterium]|nr:MAG: helix-turn-helix domain-containing protein [Candidatus Omnitrophota bacterium]
MSEKLLTTREASQLLRISEKEVIDLANANLLPHFKVAGEFLRFRREDILKAKASVKKKHGSHSTAEKKIHKRERLREFIYFNDFYIVCSVLIAVLVWVIVKDLRP